MTTAYDPRTGEVIPDLTVLAQMRVSLALAVREAEDELDRLRSDLRNVDDQIRSAVPVEGRLDAGDHWVVVQPPKPGRRLVSREACLAYQEQLLDLGLGRMVTEYRAPTVSIVDAARAELTAAGVPYSVIVPPPALGLPEVVVVPKAAGR